MALVGARYVMQNHKIENLWHFSHARACVVLQEREKKILHVECGK